MRKPEINGAETAHTLQAPISRLQPRLEGGVQATLTHHNPHLKSFADRLRKAGKPHKVIITAVARKLVTIANAVCRSRQKWTATTA